MTWKRKERIWYRIGHFLSTSISILVFRPKIVGRENVPNLGSVLITPNHRSMLDVPLLGCVTFRPLRFMAKKDLFKNKFVKWYFETNGSFSVDKNEGDPASVKKAISILKDGDALVVFPEGKRGHEKTIGELATGAVFLAVKSNSPILPVGISGLDKFILRRKWIFPIVTRAKIVVGAPIDFHIGKTGKTSELVAEVLPILSEAIQKLYDQSLELS